jgi:plasmid segregation protein ParM
MRDSVVVIEVGAGNTKYMASKSGQIVAAGHLPSVVALTGTGALASFQSERRSEEVTPVVSGATYSVSLAPNRGVAGATRVAPGDDFQNSAHHTALLAAGLYATGLKEVDILVAGTPVHTFEKHRDHLGSIRGTVDFGLGRVHISNTIVLPQPFGSLLAGIHEGALINNTYSVQLVIDVGYYSIDVLRVRGLTLEHAHSFGLEAGMGKIYRAIADALAQQLRKPVNNLDQIDHCLRTRTPYLAYGQQIALEPFVQGIAAHVDACALEIYGRVGSTENVASICVTGGGAEFFLPAIRKAFGNIPVQVLRDPLMANARGFLVAGQSALAGRSA